MYNAFFLKVFLRVICHSCDPGLKKRSLASFYLRESITRPRKLKLDLIFALLIRLQVVLFALLNADFMRCIWQTAHNGIMQENSAIYSLVKTAAHSSYPYVQNKLRCCWTSTDHLVCQFGYGLCEEIFTRAPLGLEEFQLHLRSHLIHLLYVNKCR